MIGEEEMSLRTLSVGSISGERFSSFVPCESSEKVRVLTVHAVDEYGCVSLTASFRGIVVEGSDSNGATMLNDRDSVLILPRKVVSGSFEVIESGHNRSHASHLGETDFNCLSSHASPKGNFNFLGTFDLPCAYQDSGGYAVALSGFATRLRIDARLSESPTGLALFSFGEVTLNASLVRLAGCAWLVRFRLTNGAQSTKVVDLECDAELVGGGHDFDRLGFTGITGAFITLAFVALAPLFVTYRRTALGRSRTGPITTGRKVTSSHIL
jgi:hypothetical protein